MPRSLTGILLGTLAALPLPAQAPDHWVFRSAGGARAWFDVLRDLPVSMPGPFRYYQGGDPSRAPARLRTVVARRPFEVLHFVPLYAPTLDAPALAAVLRDAAGATPAVTSPASAFLATTLRATLTAEERSVLPELAGLIERAATRLPRQAPVSTEVLETRWQSRFAPPLRSFLDHERLSAGVVLVSEAIGPEGRIFAGRPADAGDNVVALGTWAWAASPDAPLLAMLRELCFPLVTRTLAAVPALDARAGSTRSANAAVMCGAQLADAVSAESGVAYRAMWSAAATPPVRAFDARFAVDTASHRAITAALDRALGRDTSP